VLVRLALALTELDAVCRGRRTAEPAARDDAVIWNIGSMRPTACTTYVSMPTCQCQHFWASTCRRCNKSVQLTFSKFAGSTARLTSEFEGVSLPDGDWEAVMLAVAELEMEEDGVCGACGESSNRGSGKEMDRARVDVGKCVCASTRRRAKHGHATRRGPGRVDAATVRGLRCTAAPALPRRSNAPRCWTD
jgi:hypothetical protein